MAIQDGLGKTRGQHWLASTHKPRQDFSTTNSFGEAGTKKKHRASTFYSREEFVVRWRSRLGERRRKDWHQIQLADKSPRLFSTFFFKTQPKSLGTTSFQSCKKVVARGRAAGLWINVSINFRACWTIFGCRNCHIIWLWHRSLPQNLFVATCFFHSTVAVATHAPFAGKSVATEMGCGIFCHSISHVAQFVARGPPCGNVVLPQILPLATWFSRRVISLGALGHAAIFENGLSLSP